MSRSKRRTPIIPVANIESEKTEKRLAHQRERKWLHDHLNPRTASMEDFDIKMFHLHPHSGRDSFSKGGREFLGHRALYDDPRSMTK
ncbi:hypothetical protein [Aestuariivirga sp.]|uniref:hypothetical protein n=1 Tax=Aestuariivirga sp. TaxID=2650926 RepID=UPI0039E364E1